MKRGVVIISVIVAVVLIGAIYFSFFHAQTCKNLACWEDNLKKCERAKYDINQREVEWLYTIKGKSGNTCEVKVEILKINQGLEKALVLEGKSMICYLEMNEAGETIIVAPERNINLCTGILKEEMQTLMLQGLYESIVGSVGEIGSVLSGAETEQEQSSAVQNSSG